MLISVHKFGTTLISRPSGKEALLAFQSTLDNLSKKEPLVIDFGEVITLTPSWADEFLSPLIKKYKNRIKLVNTTNASVTETLKTLKPLWD
ncbi:STAS-like domain-containing protein [Patescibacteria group bacterium]|nr:STAS-like domain-containing protein [Patescibacteria group bacterium]